MCQLKKKQFNAGGILMDLPTDLVHTQFNVWNKMYNMILKINIGVPTYFEFTVYNFLQQITPQLKR